MRNAARERSHAAIRARALSVVRFPPHDERARDTEVRGPGRGGALLVDQDDEPSLDPAGPVRACFFGGAGGIGSSLSCLAARRSALGERDARRCVTSRRG
jgi:hypothetical protein